MAGLLDQATLTGSTEAMAMVTKMADWVVTVVADVLQKGGQDQWQRILATEWGGMNEVMYNIYLLTGTPAYLAVGK